MNDWLWVDWARLWHEIHGDADFYSSYHMEISAALRERRLLLRRLELARLEIAARRELAPLRECVRKADAMRDLYAIAWREQLLEADEVPQSVKDYDTAREKVKEADRG